MKRLLLLFCLMPAFISCSSDDDEATIIGTWEITYTKGYEMYGADYSKKDIWDRPVSGKYLVFYLDGGGYSYSDENTTKDRIKWSLDGDALDVEYITSSYSYNSSYIIKKLTSDKLVLHRSLSYFENTNTYRRVK